MFKIWRQFVFIILAIFYFFFAANSVLAVTCEVLHVNFTGQCVSAIEDCPSDKQAIDNSRNDLCLPSQKCCYKTAADSGTDLQPASADNIELQIPLFNYAGANNLAEYIGKIYEYTLIILVPFAIIMIIWGGLQWIMAAGEANKIKGAKSQITQAFIGLFIGLFSYIILSLVGITYLKLPSLEQVQKMEGGALTILDSAPDQPEGAITPPAGYNASDANPPGCPTDSELQTIDQSKIKVTGKRADPRLRAITLAKLYEAQEAAKKQNCTLTVTQAYRTMALQQYFYDCYKSKKCNGGNVAARPSCNAPHITGGAVDLGIKCPGCTNQGCLKQLKSIMFSVGWTHYAKEWWHYEYGTKRWSQHPGADY